MVWPRKTAVRYLRVSPGRVAVGLVLLVGLASLVAPPRRDRLDAAPHAIRSVAHPFDSDWLEIRMLLARKCAGCHRGDEQTDLTSYEAVLSARDEEGTPVVVPGSPENSLLWEQVAWNAEARADSDLDDEPLMPPEHHEWLTEGQIEQIARWIRRGALEYRLPDTCSPRPLLESDFPSARECKACHPRQYDEWSRSMHHYAQHSPIFEAFNLTLLERTGGTIGTFCSRCHTPLGTALGENGSRRNVNRSRISMEGVTCVVCHRQRRPYYKSNARQPIEPGQLIEGCMFGPFENPVRLEGAKTHPAAGAPFLKTAAFCGECHDVTSPQGVRLEEAFSEWQNSPAAREGITCQACHMGPRPGRPVADCERPLGRAAVVPGVDPERIPLRRLSNHTFAGPDYSLLPDTEFPEKLDWMYEKDYRDLARLTPYQQKTLTDLRRHNRGQLRLADAARYELLKAAARIEVAHPHEACPGAKLKVRVDVTSTTAGHSFPTGFTAERQAWVEVVLRDPQGRAVFASGNLDPNGDLRDEHSQPVAQGLCRSDRHLLNFQNKFTALTQKGTDRSVVLSVNRHLAPLNFVRPATGPSASFGRPPTFRIAKGSLPPLATIGRTYPIRLPDLAGDYHLSVRLNFRHLPPTLLDHIGASHLKHLLEIVEIDRHEALIRVQ